MPPPLAELAQHCLAGRRDGDLWLSLDTLYTAETSPWGVPAYRFDLRLGEVRAGTISLRISDDARLVRYAGHIGFSVEPACRGDHLAERAVRLLLPLAAAHGLSTLWLGCNPDNHASRRTMERLGAVYVETVDLPADFTRYIARGETQKLRFRLGPA